jgi:uncharacterized protein
MYNLNSAIDIPVYKILLNGAQLSDDQVAAVVQVTLEEEINLPAMFSIEFNIVDFKQGQWRGIDLKTFKPGDVIELFMGMDSTDRMIVGEVATLDIHFGEYSVMEIRGYDRLRRLQMGTNSRSFLNMKDSSIATAIATDAGLICRADDTGVIHSYVFQNNQSNYDFLLERAGRLGYEIYVNDKTLSFIKSQLNNSPELELKYGFGLSKLDIRLQTLITGNQVEVRGWDEKNKKEIKAVAGDGSENTIMGGKQSGYQLTEQAFGEATHRIAYSNLKDNTEAEMLAKANYNLELQEFITGEGVCTGNSKLRVGKTVKLTGLGERFNGVYYVVSTVHTLNGEGYMTHIRVKRTGT